jgi:Uma2 family endonuclease
MSAILVPDTGTTRRPTPPLENGDRLTRAEYLKRYAAMPPHVKAERIEGIVYMAAAAAVSAGFHGQPHVHMATWLGTYMAMTPGTAAADNSTILLDIDNDPQPDLCLYILPANGGRVKLDTDQYIVGAPELVVEIAASSMSYDLGAKLNAYRRNGVKEYIVHRTYDGEIDWFALRDGQYEKASAEDGVYRSQAFPGLWLNRPAMLEGKLANALATLREGLAGSDHAEFVKQLAAGPATG